MKTEALSTRIPTRTRPPQKQEPKPASMEKPKIEKIDRVRFTKEAQQEQTPNLAVPRFDRAFETKPGPSPAGIKPAAEPPKTNSLLDAQRLALQFRVTAGQTATATNTPANPALRTLGGIGGLLGGTGLVTQGLQRGGLDGAAQVAPVSLTGFTALLNCAIC